MSLCFNRWNFVWFFVWLVYCIDVVASFPGSCNINNWKAGGGGWEQGYLCGFVWGQSWADETTRRRPKQLLLQGENWANNLLSICKILTWCGETLLKSTAYTMFFSCNSEEPYEISSGINYGVGSKTVPALLDCRKPRTYALRVKQQ